MKRKSTKIMVIVSVIILVLGIIISLSGLSMFMDALPDSGTINIDGTDFSGFFKLFGLVAILVPLSILLLNQGEKGEFARSGTIGAMSYTANHKDHEVYIEENGK